MHSKQIKVWDLPVRLFHWLLVASFTAAYFTEDDYLTLHSWLGYSVIGLICFRLIWGFIGSYHARFNHFVCGPGTTWNYLKDIVCNRAQRHLGHNPAGAAMILALLLSLFMTTLTGLATFATEEFSGPLVNLMTLAPDFIRDSTEDSHEFFANFTVVLIVFHLAGVAVASVSHKENLVRAMITGLKHPTV